MSRLVFFTLTLTTIIAATAITVHALRPIPPVPDDGNWFFQGEDKR
jgi:hypothetical protein